MKQRLLIVEPSELIIEGLKSILEGQIRFKVLEPEMNPEHLEERILASRPDIVLINPTMITNPAKLRGDRPIALVALVYQYVERDVLKGYDSMVDIRDSRAVIIETLAQASPGETEIADALNVSIHTVISHRKNITHKTGIKSVAGLTVYAMLNNLIDENSLL